MARTKYLKGESPVKKYSEKLVDKWFCKCVKDAGGLTFKQHPLTNQGIPDRIVHHYGRTFYVELKTTGEKCTELQIEFHKMLKEINIETYVLDVKITNFYDLYVVAYKTYDESYNKKKRDEIQII